jgi:hypothetical protein
MAFSPGAKFGQHFPEARKFGSFGRQPTNCFGDEAKVIESDRL